MAERAYTVYGNRTGRLSWRLVALVAMLVLGGLAGAAAFLARAESGHLPPGIEIDGVDVSGLSVADARTRLEEHEAAVGAEPIVLTWGDERSLRTSGSELGAQADIEDAIAVALDSRDTLSRFRTRLGLTDPIEIPLTFTVDPARLDGVLDRAEKRIERKPRSARVQLREGEVVVRPSRLGRELDVEAAVSALSALPDTVELVLHDIPPVVTDAAAEQAKATADALLTRPPAVVYERRRLELEPEVIREALRFETQGAAIDVRLDPKPLEQPLHRAFRRFEQAPKDATFRIVGQRVRVVASKPGTAVSARKTATAIVAGIGTPQIEPAFEPSQPDITTREARAMRIRRVVSEFTTPYPCCAPRVTNIQRAAEILDGYVIRPGARFSLNEALGERTAERGFVMAPMITAGRLVDAVGGGVSQVATTFYNAAFFAGLELIAHTPHEFYISRYPMGREATVSWGGPELIFRNDWPAGILVQVIATDTSITVRFWSAKLGRRVETETGEPYAYTSASTVRVYNPALPPGTETTVQFGGISGFTVAYTRQVYRGDELTRDEEFVVRYLPENTIVEYGPEAAPSSAGGGGSAAGGGGGGGGGGSSGAGAGAGSSSEPPAEEPAGGSGSGEPPPPP
jgi:vancomycin resistance protein YoaR